MKFRSVRHFVLTRAVPTAKSFGSFKTSSAESTTLPLAIQHIREASRSEKSFANHQCLHPIRASARHGCMELTQDSVRQIECIHSEWIRREAAGEDRRLLDLCADEIAFWPPDSPPRIGREAIGAQISRASERVESIEIADRSIRGSNEIAYLTASYKTQLASAQSGTSRQILGSHIWILKNHAGRWQVILVAWSRWL
jgi:ketosteroid isomerase-like protein